ncbi:MAG: nuclear transport factor 2 family protein [Gammaproteobacteria bacterium]|nr:nuclear transport factor 2 family protein [Gammaproteobacteria bacterium]
MLSQQELSDRFEIQDLVFHYADLIDSKQIARLRDEVFTEDAHIDYSVMGGTVGDVDTTIEFLESTVGGDMFPHSQHLNANVQIAVDGDTAVGRVMCFNPMQMALSEDTHQVFFLGLWYVDEYRRTPAGWRMSRRAEEKSWAFNTPDFMTL